MTEGKQFENDIQNSFKKTPFLIIRLRDSAKWTEEGASFSPSQQCDSIIFIQPFLFPTELKSTKGASISFYPKTPWEKSDKIKGEKMIKPHQIKELMKFAEKQGVLAGLIFNYRPRELKKGTTPNRVFFVHIKDFVKFAKENDKASIAVEDCEKIGVEINGRLKEIHYSYDIADFIDRAIPIYINCGYIDVKHLQALREWLDKVVG